MIESPVALPDLAATRDLGARLARLLAPGTAVTLAGDLGAGKTELARAILRARLGDPALEVPSPTFTLVQTYAAADPDLEIWHVDLYRLADPEEVLELGLDDAFAEAAMLIEWPDRLGPLRPAERLDIGLDLAEDGTRRAVLTPVGGSWRARLAEGGA